MRYALALVGVLIVAVLGWGYWHVTTHADVNVYVNDVALKNDRQLYGEVPTADLELRDGGGALLARARVDRPQHLVSIEHPAVGDCGREERQASQGADGLAAWRRCYETKSRWFSTWVRRVRSARVALPGCTVESAPVSLDVFRDAWWLWWVPLPHVGGHPSTYVTLSVWVDGASCRAASSPR
jgi:hypothetical protein